MVFCFSIAARAEAPAKGPAACEEGLLSFPFLRPWAQKLSNFKAPVDSGNTTQGALFYAVDATLAGKNAVEAWKNDSATLAFLGRKKTPLLKVFHLGQGIRFI